MKKLLFIIIFLFSQTCVWSKTVKYGSYIRYEGEHQKKTGPTGVGSLVMRTKKATGLERLLVEASTASNKLNNRANKSRRNPQPQIEPLHPMEAVVADSLLGTFDGNHVTEARLCFANGVSFVGTVDYEVDCSQKGTDRIVYKLINGALTYDNNDYQISEIVPEGECLTITRTINDRRIYVSSSPFYRVSDLRSSTRLGPFVLKNILKDYKEYLPVRFTGSRSIDSLENVVLQTKGYPMEKWGMKEVGSNTIKDTKNRTVSYKAENGIYTIRLGEDEYVKFNESSVISFYRKFDSTTLRFSDKGSEITFPDGSRYNGSFTIDNMDSYGVIAGQKSDVENVLSKVLSQQYYKVGLSYFTGEFIGSTGNLVTEFFYGHTTESLKSRDYTGTWEFREANDFEKMHRIRTNSYITINKDGTYTLKRDDKSYGNLVVFQKLTENGFWKLDHNCLVLSKDPNSISESVVYYPGQSSFVSVEQLDSINRKEQIRIENKLDSLRSLPSCSDSYDIYHIDDKKEILFFKDNKCYGFFRTKITTPVQYDKSCVIGRWGIADLDQVIDINSDGSYNLYLTKKMRLSKWTETFQTCISGKWMLNNDELVLISNPKLIIVNAFVESPSYYVSKAEVNKRNAELRDIAVSAQIEKRSTTYPAGTYSKITYTASDCFYAKDIDDRNFQFFRLQ